MIPSTMIVGGEYVSILNEERYNIFSPADGQPVGSVPLGHDGDARRAMSAAASSLPRWREVPARRRAEVIERGIELVEEHASKLAVVLTREQGKPLAEATAELAAFITRMRSFARLARSTPDGYISLFASKRASCRPPFADGVTVALVSWNFPVGLLAKRIGPSLLAGGTVVVKPAFSTPLTTLGIVGLMNDAGLPPGVLNCVTGRGNQIGAALVAHPAASRVHLTGDDATGRMVAEAAAQYDPELLLELAGSDPMIVCRDADLAKAVDGAVIGRYLNAGQVCTAVKRLYVDDAVYEEFVSELCRRVRLVKPGNGLTPATAPHRRLGPLHTAEQRDRIELQLQDAVTRGAQVLVGGRRPTDSELAHGYYFEPTVVVDVDPASRLVCEEVFGPVLPVFRTRDVADAIRQANASQWDLSASIWTEDYEMARRVSPEIRCRQLWINRVHFGSEHLFREGDVLASTRVAAGRNGALGDATGPV